MLKRNIHLALLMLFLVPACNITVRNRKNLPAKVEVIKKNEKFQLEVNGKPFYVKGAGLEFGNIDALGSHGANSFRTWRTENGKEDALVVLDKAFKNGLMVLMGLEVGRERHGYDYSDTVWVKKQFNYIKGEVERLKHHPALLGWIIGNELNLLATNFKVFDAVNDLSEMIHEVDPNHVTTTALSGIGKKEIDYIREHCNDLDFICIQIYGDIVNLQQRITESGWNGPYMVTEWGATGHWEVPRTTWGAPVEQTSSEKAGALIKRYQEAIQIDTLRCLGSYVFLWGQKQERTPTWYGMFLETGEETESVDAMHYLWNGKWPENRCPSIGQIEINGKDAYSSIIVSAGNSIDARVVATDPESDSLWYKWEIMPESSDLGMGGDFESRPASVLTLNSGAGTNFNAPSIPGAYRLFIYILDNKGNAATANIPFYVED
ncbi:MAG: glycosyl hydrolase family 2 [Bacteroidales bacterium]|nr:glycosyl hydrolase family 2 [Bacteroidales bacterium]MBN2762842.1 glycosyl hydrolase family 2 [Bacteroidales bacterium]